AVANLGERTGHVDSVRGHGGIRVGELPENSQPALLVPYPLGPLTEVDVHAQGAGVALSKPLSVGVAGEWSGGELLNDRLRRLPGLDGFDWPHQRVQVQRQSVEGRRESTAVLRRPIGGGRQGIGGGIPDQVLVEPPRPFERGPRLGGIAGYINQPTVE